MSWYYLTERDVMTVLVATGQQVQVRDFGLLSAAVARPGASAFGEEAYPDQWTKVAALLHSLTGNHPFVDGNKRAGWNAAWTFIEANSIGRLAADFDVPAAEQLMLDVSSGVLDDLRFISAALRTFSG
jgi:death on curing protein